VRWVALLVIGLWVAPGAMSGAFLPAWAASTGGPMPDVINLTIGLTSSSASANSFLFHTVLEEKPQFFHQAGLSINSVSVQMGQTVQLVESGNPPVLETGQTLVAVGYEHGATDIKIFAGVLQKSPYELVVRKGISQFTQIKTLGVPSVASASSQNCQAILRSAHMQVNRDYSLVLLGSSGARVVAVQAGKVDGSCEVLPYPELYHDKYGMTVLAKASTYLPYFASGAWVYNMKWARDPVHHAALVRFAEAILLASQWVMDPANKSEIVALVVKTFNLPEKYAQLVYAEEVGNQMMTPDAYVPKQAALGNVQDSVNAGLVKKPLDPSQYYDWSIVQEAAKVVGVTIRQAEF
jgi:hypothetical protein